MPKDLTWNQLKQDFVVNDAITLSGSDILLNISKVTGDNYQGERILILY
jgi:hypothetical protein